ncbi:hypothetical protein LCGC14_1668020 [marine sediment metagenome]|uniref:Uncharacterized protein n=1 Tax=marine sediment metagenome TaxID=412755 RepID=A0A0F9IER0_9ZZZZ
MKDALSFLCNYVKEITTKVIRGAIYFFIAYSYSLETAIPGARAMTTYSVIKS